MLQTLQIKNLALVESVQVDFTRGLNIVTGETGAGKSIIIGALNLLLGERADKNIIREDAGQCSIEAVFNLPAHSETDRLLQEYGLPQCAENALVLRRILSPAGGGRQFVNDSPVTLQVLKSIGDLLVDMHGPHDHQSLLNRDFQLMVLDSFADAKELLNGYKQAYRDMLDLESDLKALDSDDQQVTQQIDVLSFQVKEIGDAELTDADETDLEREHIRVANAQRILELADAANNALTESDSSAFNALVQGRTALSELAPLLESAGEWRDEVESILVRTQELTNSLSSAVDRIDTDPQRLQWLEDRMALIHKLKRKYGPTVEEILALADDARNRLEDLEMRGERIAEIAAKLDEAKQNVQSAGRKLSAHRNKAADHLAKAITAELRDLGFEHGAFGISIQSRAPGPSGLDEIEFGFAPNAGEPMRPLRAIASSGEISRVMLATKVILAAYDRIPVLVFDEIDANVGGKTSNAVGEKLASVASSHQVLCITHLPQVAVHGSSHYVVAKSVEEGRTRTLISPLKGDERATEIARMLGGKDLTSVTMKHAKEMLRKSAPKHRKQEQTAPAPV